MRYGFITCVRLGQACIDELLELGADLALLGTLTDAQARDKSGRIYLDQIAEAHDIPLIKFRNVNDPLVVEALVEARLDWLFIIGWSQIAQRPVLDAPRLGTVGIHPTLLPVGRGRASIPWAIIKGLDETGVTMFKLDEGMDTGPILGQVTVPIEGHETSTTLYDKVVAAHRALINDTFPALESGNPTMREQDETHATVWPGRQPADGELDLTAMSATEVDRYVRALTRPYPGAFVRNADGAVTRIWGGRLVEPGDPPTIGGDEVLLQAAGGTAYLATDLTRD